MPALLALGTAELAILLLMLAIIACAIVYQSLLWMQQRGASLPVVGPTWADMIGAIMGAVRGIAHSMESALAWCVQVLPQAWGTVVRFVVAPAEAALHALVSQAQAYAHMVAGDLVAFKNLASSALSALRLELGQLRVDVGHQFSAFGSQVRGWIDASSTADRRYADQQVAQLQRQLLNISADLQHQLAQLDGRLQAMEQYARILAGLRGFEQTTGADVAGLLGRTHTLGGELSGIAGQLGGVLPLAGVAALGADAIANLVKVAEDPCYCLTAGAGAGLEARVALLELGAF